LLTGTRATGIMGSDEEPGRAQAVRFCGGCVPSEVGIDCRDSFARLGVLKVHWECWSNCNLSCGFCYRSLGDALDEKDGSRLIAAIYSAGAKRIVFAGGDPSLRPDIGILVRWAKILGLRVEIQTNGHHVRSGFREALLEADLIGLSLDGATAEAHDDFRSTRGNFQRVLELFDFLERQDIQVIVRTVVSRRNYDQVLELGEDLRRRKNLCRWSLLEFSPVGLGYHNLERYRLSRSAFDELAQAATDRYGDDISIDVYRLENKVGTYLLITPSGLVYGTAVSTVNGVYPPVGSILREHLRDLAHRTAFRAEQHQHRYAEVEARLDSR
jgi:MoaA/NifB/PqqE/SkfB family radical SAM enzyme